MVNFDGERHDDEKVEFQFGSYNRLPMTPLKSKSAVKVNQNWSKSQCPAVQICLLRYPVSMMIVKQYGRFACLVQTLATSELYINQNNTATCTLTTC